MPDRSAGSGSQSALLRFGAVMTYIVLWSSGFIPSRVLLQEMTPLRAAVVRLAAAGALLAIAAVVLRVPFPRGRDEWLKVLGIGFFTNVVYLALLYVALRHLSAGMSAIIASTNPLMLALLAPAFLGERLGARKLTGLAIGFGGVAFMMIARFGLPTEAPRDEMIALVSVFGLVASTLIFKRVRGDADLLAVTGMQLLFGALLLLVPALLIESGPLVPQSAAGWASMLYLVIVMSVGASVLWFWLLRHGEASTVSAYYFLTPVFGIVLSRLILGERLTLTDAFGAVVIAAGIALVQRASAPGS